MALENKTLLELANEADPAKFKEGFEKLPQDDQKLVSAHLSEEAVKAKTERDAATAEKRRQEDLAAKAKTDAEALAKAGQQQQQQQQPSSFEQKFRDENISEGFARVFSEMGITKDEDKQGVRDTFKKLDSGAVNVDNIVKDIKKAVLATNPEVFLEAKKKAEEFEKGAEEFNRNSAGNAGGNTKDEDKGKQYSKEAQDMVRDAARRGTKLNLEEAENYLKNGATRIIQ